MPEFKECLDSALCNRFWMTGGAAWSQELDLMGVPYGDIPMGPFQLGISCDSVISLCCFFFVCFVVVCLFLFFIFSTAPGLWILIHYDCLFFYARRVLNSWWPHSI